MPTTTPQVGPLQIADLHAIWDGVVDESYSEAFEQAGEGNGFEAYTQAWAQFARVSEAVDTTTQSMFILPWSGQTGAPASGPQKATVTLTLNRTKLVNLPLVLAEGTFSEEQQTDWGQTGGVPVLTGRRYALSETVVFEPGQTGPITALATAERAGWGYDNPAPGTLIVIDQPGTNFGNIDATVRGFNYPAGPIAAGVVWQVLVDAIDQADAFIPDHVGQYILFESGANAGKIGRIVSYLPPNLTLTPPTGGTVGIELIQSIRSFAGHFAGTFSIGEQLVLKNGATTTGFGRVLDAQLIGGDLFVTFTRLNGVAVTSLTGSFSGATATVDVMLYNQDWTFENFDASWRILDWVGDWGLTSTNLQSPAGGRAGMLDELGRERDIYRSSGEPDDAAGGGFRQRVAQIADTVSPNAIKRALNRGIPGVAWCFREVGSVAYPGLFFDHDPYDYDLTKFTTGPITGTFVDGETVEQVTAGVITTGVAHAPFPVVSPAPGPLVGSPTFLGISGVSGPVFVPGSPIVGLRSGATFTPSAVTGGLNAANRFRVWINYTEMRAWFFVDVPNLDTGDDGFAYDDHPTGAYDAGPKFFDFYDGEPWVWARQLVNLWAAIEKIRASGTGWTLEHSTGPCP